MIRKGHQRFLSPFLESSYWTLSSCLFDQMSETPKRERIDTFLTDIIFLGFQHWAYFILECLHGNFSNLQKMVCNTQYFWTRLFVISLHPGSMFLLKAFSFQHYHPLPPWLYHELPLQEGERNCGVFSFLSRRTQHNIFSKIGIQWWLVGEGNGYPLQYSCLENSMDWGAWQIMVHGVAKESDTTEQPSTTR